jgi:RNA recognition motif-containing protein
VEFLDRSHAEQAIQRFNGQVLNGRPIAVSEARAREDRGPSSPRPGGPPPPRFGSFPPRQGPAFGGPRPFESGAPQAPRSRNFGPDAKPQRGSSQKGKKKDNERPRGPIPLKVTGRSFTLEDDSTDEALPYIDDFATSKPPDEEEDENKS